MKRYQFSKNKTTFWMESTKSTRPTASNRRDNNAGQFKRNKSETNESSSNNRNQSKQNKFNRKSKGNSTQMEVD